MWRRHLILRAFKVNRTYFDHRSLEHEVGSLEAVVSKLIKNWDAWLRFETIGFRFVFGIFLISFCYIFNC